MKLSKVLFGLIAVLGLGVMFALVGSVDSHATSAQSQFCDLGKKFGQIEVLAIKKNEWAKSDTVCGNNGNRIFFPFATTGTIGRINWLFEPDTNGALNITDCDGTDSTRNASVEVSVAQPYYVVVELVGPPTAKLRLICTDVLVNGVANEDICIMDIFDLSTHDGWTKIIADVLADDLEGVTWDLVCVAGDKCARHLKVQLFEIDPSGCD